MTDLIASGAESSEFNVLAVPIGELIIGTVAFLIVFFVLGKLREEAAGIRAAAQAERADIIEKARSEAQAAAAAVTASAQAQIEQEKNKAGSDLQRNVGAIATDLAGRIVGEVLTDNATAQGVVDRFISELEAASGSNGKA